MTIIENLYFVLRKCPDHQVRGEIRMRHTRKETGETASELRYKTNCKALESYVFEDVE